MQEALIASARSTASVNRIGRKPQIDCALIMMSDELKSTVKKCVQQAQQLQTDNEHFNCIMYYSKDVVWLSTKPEKFNWGQVVVIEEKDYEPLKVNQLLESEMMIFKDGIVFKMLGTDDHPLAFTESLCWDNDEILRAKDGLLFGS